MKPGAVEPVVPDGSSMGWDGAKVRRRKKESSSKFRKETLLRTIAIGVFAVGVLGVIAYVGFSNEREVNSSVWHDPGAGAFDAKAQGVMPLTEDDALRLVRKVLAARSPEQLAEVARMKDISSGAALEFLSQLEEKNGKISRMDWIGNMDSNDIQIEAVEIVFEKETSRPCRALLTPNESGVWQVDVAAMAATCSEPWQKVIAEPRIQADLRVVIARDNYYNGRFSSDREWSAYAMASPGSDTLIIGYCPHDGEIDRILNSLLKENRGIRAMVRVRKNDQPNSRQCEIISLLAEDWILTDSPLEERSTGSLSKSGEGR